MFDFAWSELGVIAVVALIFIGPKDMPVALKSVTGMIKKARRMASEFQTHVDDMVRDADLHEVRDQLSSLRGYTVKGALEKFVDDDGSIRRSFEDPFIPGTPAVTEAKIAGDVAVAERADIGTEIALEPAPAPVLAPAPMPERPLTPAFIPPGAAPISAAASGAPEPPAFIPPGAAPPA